MQKVHVQKEHIEEAFNFRHACKEFDPKRVISPEDIEFQTGDVCRLGLPAESDEEHAQVA